MLGNSLNCGPKLGQFCDIYIQNGVKVSLIGFLGGHYCPVTRVRGTGVQTCEFPCLKELAIHEIADLNTDGTSVSCSWYILFFQLFYSHFY